MFTVVRNLRLPLQAHHHTHRVNVQICWSSANPYEVQLFITSPGGVVVEWVVGRDLLTTALDSTTPVGDGDIHIRPHWGGSHFLEVVLRAPSGTAALIVERLDLLAFLQRTWSYVDVGAEPEVPMEVFDAEVRVMTALYLAGEIPEPPEVTS